MLLVARPEQPGQRAGGRACRKARGLATHLALGGAPADQSRSTMSVAIPVVRMSKRAWCSRCATWLPKPDSTGALGVRASIAKGGCTRELLKNP